jgi:hypothetical protein
MVEIFSELESLKLGSSQHPASFVIQGGYFESARGLDQFARASLERAFELGSRLKNKSHLNQVKYDILINDLGISCANNVCDTSGTCTNQDANGVQSAIDEARKLARPLGIEFTTTTERYELPAVFRLPRVDG